jgi:hypothetical protein
VEEDAMGRGGSCGTSGGEARNIYRVLVGKTEENKPLRRS